MPGFGLYFSDAPRTLLLFPLLYFLGLDGDMLPWGGLIFTSLESLIFLALALLLYIRRKLETAGDFLAFPWMKVVMKLFVSLMGGIGLGVILKSVLSLGDGTFSLGHTFSWLVPGVILTRLAAEMIVEKTVRVFKKRQFLQYALCLLLTVGISSFLWWDPFGIQTRVPDGEDVVSVAIDGDSAGFTAVSPDAIAAVRELHEAIIQERSLCTQSSSDTTVTFEYTLKSGATITRKYRLRFGYTYDTARKLATHPLHQKIAAFFNTPRWAISCMLGQELPAKTEDAIFYSWQELKYPVSIRIYDSESNSSLVLSSDQSYLLQYLWQDIFNGTVRWYPASGSKNARYEISFETNYHGEDGIITGYGLIWLPDDNSQTVQALRRILFSP